MAELIEKLGIDWKLILAQIVNFAILFFVLRKFAYKPILELLEKREKRIKEAQDFAEGVDKKMKELDDLTKERLNDASKKADEIVHKAKESAKEREKEIVAAALEKSKKMVDEAKWMANQEKEKALQELKGEMGSLVVLAAEKVINKDIKAEELKHLEKEAVKYL
jgi:F-type H+-transporting ATPase subunit b